MSDFEMPADSVLLLEGGALRGVFTSGVLDVWMEHNLYFPVVAAVSAGGLNAVNYLARQPGRSARINLHYRKDPRYAGPLALFRNKGLFGLDFIINGLTGREPFDAATYAASPQQLFVVATSVDTGQPAFFEKGHCSDFTRAVIASASMPLVSWPVKIDGKAYLDGGCSCPIPLDWALKQGYRRIVVVTTREKGYRKPMTSQRMVESVQRLLCGASPVSGSAAGPGSALQCPDGPDRPSGSGGPHLCGPPAAAGDGGTGWKRTAPNCWPW